MVDPGSPTPARLQEGLASKISALEGARRLLKSDPDEAAATIRRVAHALGTLGISRINAASAAVEAAAPAELAGCLDRLLAALGEVRTEDLASLTSVLIVDDDPDITVLVENLLAAPNRTILVARDGREAEQILQQRAVGLVVLDLVLPDADGRAILMRLREDPATAAVPVIVLTGRAPATVKAECFALGADDFFVKPFDPDALSAAVAARLEGAARRTPDTRIDPVTGIGNRAAFEEAFERLQALSGRTRTSLSLAMLDLDRLKEVNDAAGHAAGDEALRRAAGVFARTVRKSDFVARLGGDEFAVLYPDTTAAGAVEAVNKLLRALGEETFRPPGGGDFRLSASAGVVPVTPETRLDDAVAEADRLLYVAKTTGRARVASPDEGGVQPPRDIVVAIDDEITADIVSWSFQTQGFRVVRVRDGRAALDALRVKPAALVVLAALMPRMDGFEFLAALRSDVALARTPVLLLTEPGNDREIARASERGVDDYIVKPLSTVELIARARRLLRRA